jgi:ribosome biogenesis GTPase
MTQRGEPERHASGTVVRSTGSWYDVRLDDEDESAGRVVPSKMRGKFRLRDEDQTNPVVVGDRVTIRLNEDDTGLIIELHPRDKVLARRASGHQATREHVLVANVDVVWIAQAVRHPRPQPGFIDRVLVTAERWELSAGIVFNKMDLLREDDDEARAIMERYAGLGYDVLRTSAETGASVPTLRERLEGRTSVVTGPSGVGKSSLLNEIEPDLDLRTGEVSERSKEGRHVTTNAALHALSGGGYVADTPGVRSFGLLEIEPTELAHYFVEMKPLVNDCRFPDCTHDHEPGCAVKEALDDDGAISAARYASYLKLLEALRTQKTEKWE